MKKLPRTQSCFVCGRANSSGLDLEFETDGTIVRTRFVPKPEHVGFKGIIHGGIVATLLDEIMVWACGVQTQRFAFCAEMTVRYLQHVQPEIELVAEGELVSNRRNRIFETRAELRNREAIVLATSTGKYLPIKNADTKPFLEEFETGPESMQELFR